MSETRYGISHALSEERRKIVTVGGASCDTMTQTNDDDDELMGSSVPRAQQAELRGLKAELESLRAQIAEASDRRMAELEGGEKAHAAAMAAHGTSALHARLLWSEAHQLEEALAEAGATLAKERRENGVAMNARDGIIVELRGQLQQQEQQHQQQLSRAKADRRVLHRNSRDFLDGKHQVEKQRDALEEQLASYEETRNAL